jgi:hypothetical protein
MNALFKSVARKKIIRGVVRHLPLLGVIGTVACAALFIVHPSWPTPDKLLIFLTFVFMIFGKSADLLKRFVPFVGLLLAYESLRGLAPILNTRVEYQWMITVDTALGFGTLPTHFLQRILWNGSAQWYDFALYGIYMLHFILPFGLALLIWKYRPQVYWRYVATFITLSFAGFLTFLIMPAAPPWMASNEGYVEPIYRVSSDVWYALGIEDFPSVYNKISPNPVAAVPSLHAAYATLLAIFVWKLFGRRLGVFGLIYPMCIYFGTVYQGEHYLIDEILGSIYAALAYYFVLRCYAPSRLALLNQYKKVASWM